MITPEGDVSPAIVLANTACAATNGCEIVLKPGVRYYVNSSVTLGRNVGFRGARNLADPGNPFGVTTAFFANMRTIEALVIGPSGTIAFGSDGGLEGVYVFRSNLRLDGTDLPTSFTGTCFTTSATDGVYMRRSAIVGCGTALAATDGARMRLESNLIDCNNGFLMRNSRDLNRIDGNHFYGVTQANATGHETFSLRSGTAIGFYGTFHGGGYVSAFFSYGFHIGIDAQAPGSYLYNAIWVDAPSSPRTGYTLDPTSIGLKFAATNYIEPQVIGFKINSQGTAVALGSTTSGINQFIGGILWGNTNGFTSSALNLHITDFSIRGYDTAVIFNSAAAASSSVLSSGLLLDRNAVSTRDIDGGTGDPSLIAVSYQNGVPIVLNSSRSAVVAAAGLITIPNGKSSVHVTGSNLAITNIAPAFDGVRVTLEFAGAGSTVSGPKFMLASPFTSIQPGSNITLSYSIFIKKWVEVSRGAM